MQQYYLIFCGGILCFYWISYSLKKFKKGKAEVEKDLVSIFSSVFVFLTDDDDDYVARQETAH